VFKRGTLRQAQSKRRGDQGSEDIMYVEHHAFTPPENEQAKIWRYMDFIEFVSLLDKKALFFARVDKLGDPFECSYTKATRLTSVIHKGVYFRLFAKNLVIHTAINSWHINEYESAAMWKLYLQNNEGIAVQSTFNRLKNSFLGEKEIRIGKVQYIDYETAIIQDDNFFYAFLNKRKSFEHERELRAIVSVTPTAEGITDFSKPTIDNGIYIPVNLDSLIENIYVAPTCPKWINELIISITNKYELNTDVLQSKLDEKPIY